MAIAHNSPSSPAVSMVEGGWGRERGDSQIPKAALCAFTILAWPAPVQTSVGPQIRGHLPGLPDHVRLLFSEFLLTSAHLHLGPTALLASVCLQGCLPSVCELVEGRTRLICLWTPSVQYGTSPRGGTQRADVQRDGLGLDG